MRIFAICICNAQLCIVSTRNKQFDWMPDDNHHSMNNVLGVLLYSLRSQGKFSHLIPHRNSWNITGHCKHDVILHYSEKVQRVNSHLVWAFMSYLLGIQVPNRNVQCAVHKVNESCLFEIRVCFRLFRFEAMHSSLKTIVNECWIRSVAVRKLWMQAMMN